MNKSLPTLPPSSGLKQRAPSTLAASVPALSRPGDASSMPGGLGNHQQPQHQQRDDKDWISSTSSSSGESSSGHVQRQTVKRQREREFAVGSPRSPRKKTAAGSSSRSAGVFDGTSSPRRRKDSAGLNALLSPSKSSRSNDAKQQTRRTTKRRGTPWTSELSPFL